MIIGTFQKSGDGYSGEVLSFALHVPAVTFNAVPLKQGSGPDFVVLGLSEEDEEYEIGAAWKRTSKEGKAYLSVRLDSPALFVPINCALMPQPDNLHVLVWKRAKVKADVTPAADETAADEATA
jgi:uncharacterized protein (DUF736 family)